MTANFTTAMTTRQVSLTATGVTVPVRLINLSRVVVATTTNNGQLVQRCPFQYDGSSLENRYDDLLLSADLDIGVVCRPAGIGRIVPLSVTFVQTTVM